jgi:aspartyl-tRNA(Asn)/glutamyl-tRNA(Gln) amidotransferase subunit A
MDGIYEEIIHHREKVSSDLRENVAEVGDITLPQTEYAISVILVRF